MSVEASIYTRQPAMSGSELRELAALQGLTVRFLDLDGRPMESDAPLDEPMLGQGYVLIGWPIADAETTESVERALRERDKPAVDRLGMEGKLGWCSISCGAFDFAEFEEAMREGWEEDEEGPADDEVLERMRPVRTEYAFRCGTRPRQCSDLLGKLADLVRDATDGFSGEE